MKRIATVLFCLTLVASSWAEGWMTSWDQAAAESKRTGKPILADFTGSDWCIWCKRLKGEVFDTQEFKDWASKNVVLLELDYPSQNKQSAAIQEQNEKLKQKYSIEGYPTVLFLDHKGSELAKYGYDQGGPKVWTKKASEMLKKR